MAKSIFPTCDGVISKVPFSCEGGGGLFKFKFDGSELTMPVTGFALELSGNYQFLHTVSDFIYFYGFGDRVGELTVSGMGFLSTCQDADTKVCGIYDYYMTNRIAAKDKAISISMDACGAFFGFLTGMRLEVPRPELPIAQWVLRFHVIPNKN